MAAPGGIRLAALLLLPVLSLPLLQGSMGVPPEAAVSLEDTNPAKAILEMLHIDKLSVPRRTRPHPYMTHVYRLLNSQEDRDTSDSDGTLVKSFRSLWGSQYGPPGWIWFNLTQLKPSSAVAELVLRRRTLHRKPLSMSVTVHSVRPLASRMAISTPLDEHLLVLDRPPPSGYDVFDVSVALVGMQRGLVGFQLRYTDESGSLVLHEALTQSLYCLNGSAQSEPLLVVYQLELMHPVLRPWLHPSPAPVSPGPKQGQRHRCRMAQPRVRCTLHQHYVDLQTMADWVLQPTGFNLSSCRGTCEMENRAESTNNHRLDIQKGEEVKRNQTRSDCVPQELSALTVMYRSNTGNTIIAKLRNIKARSCVCRKNVPQD